MSTNNGSLVIFRYSEFHALCAILRQTIFNADWSKHNGNLIKVDAGGSKCKA